MTRILVRLGAVGALFVGLSGGLVGAAPPAGAVTGIQTGYWQQHPGPAQVPDGGFEIASDPTGTQAVAAVRFTLDDGESDPKLTVKVSQVVPDTSQLAVIACPVAAKSAGWQPPSGAGAWADAPQPDCTGGSATGKLSDDGTTMSFDLSFLSFTDNTVDVLLQPDLVTSPVPSGVVDGVGGEQPPTYDAAFDKVAGDQIQVTSSPSAGSASGSGGPGGYSGGTGSTGGTSSGGSSTSALGAALPSGSGVATAPAPDAGAAPPVVASSPQAVAQQPAAAQAPYLVHHGRNWRAIIAIGMVASDVLLVMLFLGHRAEGAAASRPTLSIYDLPPAPRPDPA